MKTFYHYTNERGYLGIKQSRQIRESETLDDGDDARFGKGVYLTTLPPSTDKEEIIRECWSPNVVARFLQTGRVNFYIQVKMPSNKAERATKKRNVYLHKGVLHLDNYEWESGKA